MSNYNFIDTNVVLYSNGDSLILHNFYNESVIAINYVYVKLNWLLNLDKVSAIVKLENINNSSTVKG